ncbi:MAG: serpin family protein [Cytophagales bacterium]|nr:MAG: serpin family protein [Cytophagales bacterium]
MIKYYHYFNMQKNRYFFLAFFLLFANSMKGQTAKDFASYSNQFGIRLYQELIKGNPNKNIVFSPLCLSSALAMPYWGAKGKTAEQFEKALNLINDGNFQEKYAVFLKNLEKDSDDSQVKLANTIWIQKNFTIQDTYQNILTNTFKSKAQIVDFEKHKTEAENKINNWVKEQTKEKILQLIPPNSLPNTTRLVLTNTLYFNAQWLSTFEENFTKDDTFFAPNKEIKTAFMHQKEDFLYRESDNFVSIILIFKELQYMTIIIPKESYQLSEIEKLLTPAFYQSNFAHKIDDLLGEKAAFKSTNILLSLPRFQMTNVLNMKEPLAQMGLKHAFDIDGEADFSGITQDVPLVIDEVLHNTVINLNETGVEAASATAIMFLGRGGGSIELKINRPFLFFISDGNTGSILFQGRFVNPE